MVSINLIKSLEFETIQDYFDYIIESKTNGQHKQAKELYLKLSKVQKIEFKKWLDVSFHYEALDNETTIEKEIENIIITTF